MDEYPQNVQSSESYPIHNLIAVAGIVGAIAFIAVAGGECAEIFCFIALFFAIPFGVISAGLVLLIEWLALLYARGRGSKIFLFIFEIFLAIIAGMVFSTLIPLEAESVLTLLYIPVPFYFANAWWIILITIIVSALLLLFIKPTSFRGRFWLFIIAAAIIPALVNGFAYNNLGAFLSEPEQKKDAQFWETHQANVNREYEMADQAVAADNLDACYNLSLRDRCVLGIAKKRNDVNLCKKFKLRMRSDCYEYFAKILKDVTLCDKARKSGSSSLSMDSCLRDVAEATRNITLCRRIKDQLYAPLCIYNISVALKDPKMCDLLQEDFMRTKCHAAVLKT